MPSRLFRSLLAAAAALALAGPALAQENAPPPSPPPPPVIDAEGRVYEATMPAPGAAPQSHPGYDIAAYERARADWLSECRRRHGSGNTVGGTVAGGLVGGLIGNRVAGRRNRTVGTVIGAVAGAAAGGAVGEAADRREARDYCQSYLDRYASYNHGAQGYPAQGYTHVWVPMMVAVPVTLVQTAPAAPRPETD
jgi:Glycine zipper 2TM domain